MSAKAKQHYCTHCSRTFARSEHLVRHRRTHTKEKPFVCSQCSQSFARRDLLHRHHSKHHGGNPVDVDTQLSASVATTQNSAPRPRSATSETISNFVGVVDDSHPPNIETVCTGFQPATLATVDPANTYGSINREIPDLLQIQDASEVDVGATMSAFPFESWSDVVPDWMLNFSPSASDLDLNTPRPETQGTALTAGSTEGRQSLLSRPSTPSRYEYSRCTAPGSATLPVQHRDITLSNEALTRVRSDFSGADLGPLPSGMVLSRYIRRYFRSFNRHQPHIHEPTWDPETAPSSLIFAICANGAVYDLEHTTAGRLHEAAVRGLRSITNGLCRLQTYMLCIAFAAWEGTCESALLAAKLNAEMLPELRRHWADRRRWPRSAEQDWLGWVGDESLKRVTCCLFTLNTLMGLAYEQAPAVTLGVDVELPALEEQWSASTPAEWNHYSLSTTAEGRLTFGALEAALADPSIPLPTHVGVFGCHVAMMKILNRILLLRRSVTVFDGIFQSRQADLMLRLKRWQHMWEAEPHASLSPENPQGPITFNATAVLRVAYVRLAADFSDIRAAFTFCESAEQIEPFIYAMPTPVRDQYATRAALQASLALRVPVKLGIRLISRTSFWVWSVQHALCYFDCAIFLSKWLEAVQGAFDLNSEEETVINVVQDILKDVPWPGQCDNGSSNYSKLLRSWATLLSTGETTVWYLIPKMARTLELHSERCL